MTKSMVNAMKRSLENSKTNPRLLAAGAALGLLTAIAPEVSHAWGKRGHAAVAETAASLAAATDSRAAFLPNHAFDLGYYSNVPDLVWKKPETYQTEWVEHFMDMEIFERELKGKAVEKPLELPRAAFETAFPSVEPKAGRAWWRIRELMDRLEALSSELKKAELAKEERHRLQADWLVTAGVMGHYVGDLAQPLHVTENYDGQLTEQKGIHSFFEDKVVDQFAPGELEVEVGKAAARLRPAFMKRAAQQSVQQLLEQLSRESNADLAALLMIDKRIGRSDLNKAKKAYRRMLIDRMAAGALHLAALWTRPLGWTYDGEKFFVFVSTPEFIKPGVAKSEAAPAAPPYKAK